MTRPDLRALALSLVSTTLSIPPDRVDSAHWVTANTSDLAAFARTVADAERARIVAMIRDRADRQVHPRWATMLRTVADELENET